MFTKGVVFTIDKIEDVKYVLSSNGVPIEDIQEAKRVVKDAMRTEKSSVQFAEFWDLFLPYTYDVFFLSIIGALMFDYGFDKQQVVHGLNLALGHHIFPI